MRLFVVDSFCCSWGIFLLLGHGGLSLRRSLHLFHRRAKEFAWCRLVRNLMKNWLPRMWVTLICLVLLRMFSTYVNGSSALNMTENDPCWASSPNLSRKNAYRIFVVRDNTICIEITRKKLKKENFIQVFSWTFILRLFLPSPWARLHSSTFKKRSIFKFSLPWRGGWLFWWWLSWPSSGWLKGRVKGTQKWRNWRISPIFSALPCTLSCVTIHCQVR